MLIRTLALALPVVLPNVIVPVPKAFADAEPPTKVPAKTVVPPL